MRIFSLDTSFSTVNFSIVEDGKLIFLHYESYKEKLLQLLPNVLEKHGIKAEDFDAYAVSIGVGYATPLRIGVTFMKTLAYLYKKPLIPYENLSLMLNFSKMANCAMLKVSNKIFYRELSEGMLSPIKLLKEPNKSCMCLKDQLECEKALAFLPFSAYGGLWAYSMLSEGYQGEDLFKVEPIEIK